MSFRTIGQISLILVLSSLSGSGADFDPAFRDAKQAFQLKMRRKSPTDRSEALRELAKDFVNNECADLIIKRGLGDADQDVRHTAQVQLRKLADDEEVRKHLFDELKRSLKKPVITDSAGELLRCLACTEEEKLQEELVKVVDDYLNLKKGKLQVPIALIDDFAKQGDAEAFRALKMFSKVNAFDGKFGYQRAIVQAMTHVRRHEAVTWLILHMPKTSGLIQYDIVQYLTKLTSQKFGDNDRDWLKWWKENQKSIVFSKVKLSDEDIELSDGTLSYYGIPVCAKRVVFVLDTSGSMRGEPLAAVKLALLQVLEKLPESVNFDVILFDATPTVWKPRLVPATKQAKLEIASIVQNRGTGGGTASFAAIQAAFKLEPEAIYFLSDGKPTDSQPDQIFNTFYVLNRARRVSLHTIGVLSDRSNAAELILFMKPLAEQNFGSYRFVQ